MLARGVAVVSFEQRSNFPLEGEPNHPNQRALIRPILIDFRGSRGLHVVVCAKFFCHANGLTQTV
jgi:hypothetical protein